jgi:hypothetical protein
MRTANFKDTTIVHKIFIFLTAVWLKSIIGDNNDDIFFRSSGSQMNFLCCKKHYVVFFKLWWIFLTAEQLKVNNM